MRHLDEAGRLRRSTEHGRSAEWLGDDDVRRVLADRIAAVAAELWRGVREYSHRSLVAGMIPIYPPRGPAGTTERAGSCYGRACCA